MSKGEIDELKKRRKEWYDKLNEANKKKVDKGDYTMAFLPPSDRSKQAFTGRAEVFVSGQVYADEVATATVRGAQTLDGLVVTTEVGGQKAETRTDKDGRMTIPIAQAAKAITAPTEAIIRVLDRTGNEVARAQTRILPGPAPDIVDRPTVNDIPSNLRRGDVVTIPGQSLGPQCEMIVGNQIQETLAASANEVTAYVDTPTLGTQDAWVRNPYGESRSFQTNVYSFEVSAPRTTIRRGEELTATAQYRSLRPGTQVRFTNKTPEMVTMEIAGAKMTGHEAVVTIQDLNGTIPVRVKGLNPGAFSIAYEVISSPQR